MTTVFIFRNIIIRRIWLSTLQCKMLLWSSADAWQTKWIFQRLQEGPEWNGHTQGKNCDCYDTQGVSVHPKIHLSCKNVHSNFWTFYVLFSENDISLNWLHYPWDIIRTNKITWFVFNFQVYLHHSKGLSRGTTAIKFHFNGHTPCALEGDEFKLVNKALC